MKKNVTLAGLALLIAFTTAAVLVAQDAKGGDKSTRIENGNSRTVTGCLRSQGDGNRFKLDAEDRGTWEVRSENVKLASQIGHTVTLTGSVVGDSNKESHSRMAVTKLAVVSDGCQTDIPMQQ
jgi:hypothetical protein